MTEQVRRSQPATLSAVFKDIAGEVVDPGAVTITITRADGTALVTDGATSGSGATARTYLLSAADTSDLDVLSYVFESESLSQTVVGTVEVVGAYLFTVAEARAFHDGALASLTTYPDARIEDARERITAGFEERCDVSFIPRLRRVTADGRASGCMLLPDYGVYLLRSIEERSDGVWTAWTEEQLEDVHVEPFGQLVLAYGSFTRGQRNYRVTYEYGWPDPPGEISRAALELARYQLVTSNISDRSTSVSSEAGTFAIATAGNQQNTWSAYRHYGLPNVDATLAEYWRKLPRGY